MNFPLIIPDNSTGLAEDILDNVLILIENSLSVYSEANNFMKSKNPRFKNTKS